MIEPLFCSFRLYLIKQQDFNTVVKMIFRKCQMPGIGYSIKGSNFFQPSITAWSVVHVVFQWSCARPFSMQRFKCVKSSGMVKLLNSRAKIIIALDNGIDSMASLLEYLQPQHGATLAAVRNHCRSCDIHLKTRYFAALGRCRQQLNLFIRKVGYYNNINR